MTTLFTYTASNALIILLTHNIYPGKLTIHTLFCHPHYLFSSSLQSSSISPKHSHSPEPQIFTTYEIPRSLASLLTDNALSQAEPHRKQLWWSKSQLTCHFCGDRDVHALCDKISPSSSALEYNLPVLASPPSSIFSSRSLPLVRKYRQIDRFSGLYLGTEFLGLRTKDNERNAITKHCEGSNTRRLAGSQACQPRVWWGGIDEKSWRSTTTAANRREPLGTWGRDCHSTTTEQDLSLSFIVSAN